MRSDKRVLDVEFPTHSILLDTGVAEDGIGKVGRHNQSFALVVAVIDDRSDSVLDPLRYAMRPQVVDQNDFGVERRAVCLFVRRARGGIVTLADAVK